VSYEALKGSRWQVTGMCVANGIAYLVGGWLTARRLSARIGGIDGTRVLRTYVRLMAASVPATVVGFALGWGLNQVAGQAFFGSLLGLVVGGAGMLVVFLVIARQMRIAELDTMLGTIRARIGR
jgi:putative peptidoglycan lipid II flippase